MPMSKQITATGPTRCDPTVSCFVVVTLGMVCDLTSGCYVKQARLLELLASLPWELFLLFLFRFSSTTDVVVADTC